MQIQKIREMNNNQFKKIQILGNTQVSGYFAYCRLVNYENMTQRKTIKSLIHGGVVGYYPNVVKTPFINIVHNNDIISKNNIGFSLVKSQTREGYQELGLYFYNFTLFPYIVYALPYNYQGPIQLMGDNYRIIESTNKTYSKYIFGYGSVRLYVDIPKLDLYVPFSNGLDYFSVHYIDFCISTNVPLVMEYLGEIELMQSDNKTNVNNSFFIINRYDENPL